MCHVGICSMSSVNVQKEAIPPLPALAPGGVAESLAGAGVGTGAGAPGHHGVGLLPSARG